MGFKKWSVAKTNKEFAKSISEEYDIDPIVALIASARGYSDPLELEQFLSDEPYFIETTELKDIEKAAFVINQEIEKGTLIAVFGDYDCDGVVATTLLCKYLRSRKANYEYYIPDRFSEGYGMNTDAIEKLSSDGVGLIITVDNGISCYNEINLAKSYGIKTVITDHHIPPELIPVADAIVDPYRVDCTSSYKTICGAEVAFKLICVLDNKEPEDLLDEYSDLLTVALIGDVMPVTGENRTIVKSGIKKLLKNPLTGLKAIMNTSGLINEYTTEISSTRVAFGIVPRINAAGRMGKANRAVELLCCEDMLDALKIAGEIENDNSLRQQTEKHVLEEAVKNIEDNEYKYNRVIVVSGENWHHGILGIVASRITEKYGRPSIVISSDGEISSGSGRSYKGFSLYNAINACSDLIEKFGGHELAAGLSIKDSNISEFRNQINNYAASVEFNAPVLNLDCKLNPSALNVDIAEAIKALEPFGNDNQSPLFGIYGVTLKTITPIGQNKHLRLGFVKQNSSFQALLFGTSQDNFSYQIDDVLDIAVLLEVNNFKGNTNLKIQIKSIRIAGIDDDTLFKNIILFDDFSSDIKMDYSDIKPSREEIGILYKYIVSNKCNIDRIKYVFLNTLGYAKTLIGVKVLMELGLIALGEDLKYSAVYQTSKSDLNNSITYKKLAEGAE